MLEPGKVVDQLESEIADITEDVAPLGRRRAWCRGAQLGPDPAVVVACPTHARRGSGRHAVRRRADYRLVGANRPTPPKPPGATVNSSGLARW